MCSSDLEHFQEKCSCREGETTLNPQQDGSHGAKLTHLFQALPEPDSHERRQKLCGRHVDADLHGWHESQVFHTNHDQVKRAQSAPKLNDVLHGCHCECCASCEPPATMGDSLCRFANLIQQELFFVTQIISTNLLLIKYHKNLGIKYRLIGFSWLTVLQPITNILNLMKLIRTCNDAVTCLDTKLVN